MIYHASQEPNEERLSTEEPVVETPRSGASACDEIESGRQLRLLRRLAPTNPVRRATEALLDLRPAPSAGIQPLLDALANSSDARWKERTVAAWALGRASLDPEQSLAATEMLCRVLENRQIGPGRRFLARASRTLFQAAAPLLLLPALYAAGPFLSNLHDEIGFRWGEVAYFAGSLLAFLLYYGLPFLCLTAPFYALFELVAAVDRANNVRVMAAASLGRIRLPQSISALAGVAYDGSRSVAVASGSALRHILPVLRNEHYGQLGAQTVPNLCRLLGHPSELFVLELLQALGKVGDGRAVSAVEWLARQGETVWLREAAERILPILKERQQRENAPKLLLRPSSACDQTPETLLRAAPQTTEASPNHLLRASATEEIRGEETVFSP